jgi:hypothetical protein
MCSRTYPYIGIAANDSFNVSSGELIVKFTALSAGFVIRDDRVFASDVSKDWNYEPDSFHRNWSEETFEQSYDSDVLLLDKKPKGIPIYWIINKKDGINREFSKEFSIGAFLWGMALKDYIIIKSDNRGDRIYKITSSDISVITKELADF